MGLLRTKEGSLLPRAFVDVVAYSRELGWRVRARCDFVERFEQVQVAAVEGLCRTGDRFLVRHTFCQPEKSSYEAAFH